MYSYMIIVFNTDNYVTAEKIVVIAISYIASCFIVIAILVIGLANYNFLVPTSLCH